MFLEQYWGGPRTYSDQRGHPRLRMRHAPFRIGLIERDAWLRCMHTAVASIDSADPRRRAPQGAARPTSRWPRTRWSTRRSDDASSERTRCHAAVVGARGVLPGLSAVVRRQRRRRRRRPRRRHRQARLPGSAGHRRDLAQPGHGVADGRPRLRRRRSRATSTRCSAGIGGAGPADRRRRTRAASRSRWTWCPTTPARQHPWFQAALAAGPGSDAARALHLPRRPRARRRSIRRTTGCRCSAARPGPGSPNPTAIPASGTCTCSTPSSPT